MNHPSLTVIVLGYGAEKLLEACLSAIARQLLPNDELVLVDNGIVSMTERRAALAALSPRIQIVGDGTNRGFAGGCNFGATSATGERLVFVNSDAIVEEDAIHLLAAQLDEEAVGIASGCLLLADAPLKVNSVGNPVHYLGVTWAGACGEPYADHQGRGPITCATGGFFAIRRALWERLGGFEETYFAYHEDTDLSLRARHLGYRIDYIPTARALHHYEFSRNPHKMFLLERNRLLMVATDYPPAVRRRVMPMMIATEPLFLVLAGMQGWLPQKIRAWWWMARNRGVVRDIRDRVQSGRMLPPAQFADLLVPRIEPTGVPSPRGMSVVNAILAGYWRVAKPTRGSGGPTSRHPDLARK